MQLFKVVKTVKKLIYNTLYLYGGRKHGVKQEHYVDMEVKMSVIKVDNLTKIYRQRQRKSGLLAAIKTLFLDDTVYKTAVDDVSEFVLTQRKSALSEDDVEETVTWDTVCSRMPDELFKKYGLYRRRDVVNILVFADCDDEPDFEED